MAKLRVQFNPKHKQMVYTIFFNPSVYNVEEASTYGDSFEGCLDFIMEQFNTRTRLLPHMERFTFTIEGDLPKRQKEILEKIVGLYNRSPELYEVFADSGLFQSLGEYFGHIKPKLKPRRPKLKYNKK